MYRKYKAKKVVIDGYKFDSQMEGKRYVELKKFQEAGLISNLELQPAYELQPKFKKNGKTYRSITYIADFRYKENEQTIIEDVKGMKTPEYKLKKKLFEYKYPELTIKEITK